MEKQLIEWMKEFVEQPNPKLGNWAPCPYARAARINNQIEIRQGTNPLVDVESINWKREVYVFWYPTEQYTGLEFEQIAQDLNDAYMPNDIVVLEDHPQIKVSLLLLALYILYVSFFCYRNSHHQFLLMIFLLYRMLSLFPFLFVVIFSLPHIEKQDHDLLIHVSIFFEIILLNYFLHTS